MDPNLDDLQSRLDTLRSQYDLLEKADTPDYQRLTALQEQIDQLTRRIREIASRPLSEPGAFLPPDDPGD